VSLLGSNHVRPHRAAHSGRVTRHPEQVGCGVHREARTARLILETPSTETGSRGVVFPRVWTSGEGGAPWTENSAHTSFASPAHHPGSRTPSGPRRPQLEAHVLRLTTRNSVVRAAGAHAQERAKRRLISAFTRERACSSGPRCSTAATLRRNRRKPFPALRNN
jgi:hypothetical protein